MNSAWECEACISNIEERKFFMSSHLKMLFTLYVEKIFIRKCNQKFWYLLESIQNLQIIFLVSSFFHKHIRNVPFDKIRLSTFRFRYYLCLTFNLCYLICHFNEIIII